MIKSDFFNYYKKNCFYKRKGLDKRECLFFFCFRSLSGKSTLHSFYQKHLINCQEPSFFFYFCCWKFYHKNQQDHCPNHLPSSVSISIYSFCLKIFHSFINEAFALGQIFHSFQRDKYPTLNGQSTSFKSSISQHHLPTPSSSAPFSCCLQGISVLEDLFCFNKPA